MPRGRGQVRVADDGLVRGRATAQGDVAVARFVGTVRQGLELVVALAREVVLRQAVPGDVLTGDAHAPDPHRLPAVRFRVPAGRLPDLDPPQLLLSVARVVPVVGHAQVPPTGSVPVAEQDGQGAEPGLEGDGLRVGQSLRRRSEQPADGARVERLARRVEGQVVAQGQRGPGRSAFPGRTEGDRPVVLGNQAERLVPTLEPAVAETAEDDVLAEPEHDEVRVAIALDVQRVGAGDVVEVGGGTVNADEAQRGADRAVVPEQRRRPFAAGKIQVLPAIAVAVEDGHAAADEEREAAVVGVLDAGGRGLLDEAWRPRGVGRGRRSRSQGRDDQRAEGDGRADDRHDRQADGEPHPPPRHARHYSTRAT
jgi:hypothetical protein